jgi:hypothetical protein
MAEHANYFPMRPNCGDDHAEGKPASPAEASKDGIKETTEWICRERTRSLELDSIARLVRFALPAGRNLLVYHDDLCVQRDPSRTISCT